MKNSVETFGVFLLGTAVGAALGILFAPDAGEETRNSLVETATNSWDSIKEKVKTGEEELSEYKDKAVEYKDQVVDQAKTKVSEAKDKAVEYKDQVVDQAKTKVNEAKEYKDQAGDQAKSKVKDEAADLNDKIQQA